MIITSISFLR